MAGLFGKDMITTQEWSKSEIGQILRVAKKLKKLFKAGKQTPYLKNETLFLLFFFSSTRTRTSFEAAMDQLGGNPHDLVSETLQIKHGDTSKEIGRILSSYGHGIAIRQCDWGIGNKYMREVAKYSQVPVFNMQCDIYHPFQALADVMTIQEWQKSLKGRKIVMSWAYASSYTKPISVPQSFLLLASRFGAKLTLAHPKGFELMPEILKQVEQNIRESGGRFEIVNDMKQAFVGADVVYPKSWGPLVTTTDPDKCTRMAGKYKSWMCDSKMMKLTKKDAMYLHCLPADRGIEVADEVIDGPQSAVWDEAENRLHVQKAVLGLTMSRRKL